MSLQFAVHTPVYPGQLKVLCVSGRTPVERSASDQASKRFSFSKFQTSDVWASCSASEKMGAAMAGRALLIWLFGDKGGMSSRGSGDGVVFPSIPVQELPQAFAARPIYWVTIKLRNGTDLVRVPREKRITRRPKLAWKEERICRWSGVPIGGRPSDRVRPSPFTPSRPGQHGHARAVCKEGRDGENYTGEQHGRLDGSGRRHTARGNNNISTREANGHQPPRPRPHALLCRA
jgi:hypothetical protein